MARRSTSIFNLSFLDLLSGALGAIIFLFIITPKGGAPAAQVQQAGIYFDTTEMKIFGSLDDSLKYKQVGDTIFAVLVDYKTMPSGTRPKPTYTFQRRPDPKPKPQPVAINQTPKKDPTPAPKPAPTPKKVEPTPKKEPTPTPTKKETVKKDTQAPKTYAGDAPSIPCKVSFEINWKDIGDNVDLFVCKGKDCVFGGRKRDKDVGEWDSGKSRNRLFGSDLRTNQEAVRQFDRIIPGEYKIYAQFKESKKKNTAVLVRGLVYTKGRNNKEQGESFSKNLKVGKNRILLGRVILNESGTFRFIKN